MVVGGLGGKTANSGLRFGCLVQQPVNFGGLPLQTAAIDMVGGGLPALGVECAHPTTIDAHGLVSHFRTSQKLPHSGWPLS